MTTRSFFKTYCNNDARQPEQMMVDRLPNSFVHDPTTFSILLREQIERSWPSMGRNFGRFRGFFDGTFPYIFHLNRDRETYSMTTCIMECYDCRADEKRLKGRKRVIDNQIEALQHDAIIMEWTDHQELILKMEGLPTEWVQHEFLANFEDSAGKFAYTAHQILNSIQREETEARRKLKPLGVFLGFLKSMRKTWL